MKTDGYFRTSLQTFEYKPLLKNGHIVKNMVVLKNDVIWVASDGCQYKIPSGFVFDLASFIISGLFFKKLGRHQRAACIHDWFYVNNIRNRDWSDEQFSQAMGYDKVSKVRKSLMWAGVSVFGVFAWGSKRELHLVNIDTMERIKKEN